MHFLPILTITFILCSNAFAETVRVTQNDINVQVSLSPTTITVGDPVQLQIEATSPNGTTLLLENDTSYGSFTVVQSRNLLDIPSNDGRLWNWTIQLDTFDSTTTFFDGLKINWTNQAGENGSITFDPIPVVIHSVAGDSLNDMVLRDIKGAVPLITKNWALPIVGGVLFLGILSWFYLLVTKRREPKRSPHEQAMHDITTLRGSNLEVQQFYTSLSDIVRHYLEGQFRITATGQTTREFLNAAKKNTHLEQSDRESLGSFLVAADLVKFARYEPGSKVNDDAIHLAEVFIQETAEVAA